MARDFNAFNARLPVAHVRFRNVDEWQLVVSEAARRGISINALIRILAVEGSSGNQSSNTKTHRALAPT
jgi:hypothetical protein